MASYTTQKVIVRREAERYEAGGHGHGYSRTIAAGRTLTITPQLVGFGQWRAGDYMYGNFDIIWGQFSRVSRRHSTPHALRCVLYLVSTCTCWTLTGACNPMLCPNWGFRCGTTGGIEVFGRRGDCKGA